MTPTHPLTHFALIPAPLSPPTERGTPEYYIVQKTFRRFLLEHVLPTHKQPVPVPRLTTPEKCVRLYRTSRTAIKKYMARAIAASVMLDDLLTRCAQSAATVGMATPEDLAFVADIPKARQLVTAIMAYHQLASDAATMIGSETACFGEHPMVEMATEGQHRVYPRLRGSKVRLNFFPVQEESNMHRVAPSIGNPEGL